MTPSKPQPRCPERFETPRLVLRKPAPEDAAAIFSTYASDPEVGRYLAWPVHETLDDTRGFLAFSEAEWSKWPGGPYLIETRDGDELVGSTGLAFEGPSTASTGFVIARSRWGQGLASESLRAIIEIAQAAGVETLYALCHPQHTRSQRVLRKCGMVLAGTLAQHTVFPNHGDGANAAPEDVLRFECSPTTGC